MLQCLILNVPPLFHQLLPIQKEDKNGTAKPWYRGFARYSFTQTEDPTQDKVNIKHQQTTTDDEHMALYNMVNDGPSPIQNIVQYPDFI